MQKDATVILTQKDLDLYNKGEVSNRLDQTWGLTFDELHEIITTSNYKLLPYQEDNTNYGC